MKDMHRKLNIFLLVIGICLAIILGRLAQLQILQGEHYSKVARFNLVRTSKIPAPRGGILDRAGRVFAYDEPRLNICAVLSEIEDINIFCKQLAPLINETPGQIRKTLARHKSEIYEKIVIKPKVDTATMMKVLEEQSSIPGLYMEVQPVREYPCSEIASHLMGYVGEITEKELASPHFDGYMMGDVVGKDGLEKYYEQYLHGHYGERRELIDAAGKIMKTISEEDPRPGYNIYLTIDLELQKKCEGILKRYIDSLSAISGEKLSGCVILMDNNNGEILTMASYPNFNPNLFSKGISAKDYKELTERKDYPLLNRCTNGAFPAASTFKIVTAAAALQEGICTRYSPFYCPGKYKVGNAYFNCFVKTGHGKIDFHKSISESCDVAFYFLGEKLGLDRLLKYARQFGLGKKTGIDLPGEIPGLLPDEFWKKQNLKEPWYTGDTVNMSIGQGYLGVTPLQMAVVTGLVANRGTMYKPHLVKGVERSDGKSLLDVKPKVKYKLDVDPGHLDAIRDGMREAVLTGTAKSLAVPSLRFAGKTGTAESFPCPENPRGRNHTWFVGFGPVDDPGIVAVVFLEKSGGLAGRMAVPLAGAVLDEYNEIKNNEQKEKR